MSRRKRLTKTKERASARLGSLENKRKTNRVRNKIAKASREGNR